MPNQKLKLYEWHVPYGHIVVMAHNIREARSLARPELKSWGHKYSRVKGKPARVCHEPTAIAMSE